MGSQADGDVKQFGAAARKQLKKMVTQGRATHNLFEEGRERSNKKHYKWGLLSNDSTTQAKAKKKNKKKASKLPLHATSVAS
jgi:hypothetical protein